MHQARHTEWTAWRECRLIEFVLLRSPCCAIIFNAMIVLGFVGCLGSMIAEYGLLHTWRWWKVIHSVVDRVRSKLKENAICSQGKSSDIGLGSVLNFLIVHREVLIAPEKIRYLQHNVSPLTELSAALEGMFIDALCLLPLLNFHGRQSMGLSNGTEALLSLQSSDPSHCPRVLEVS